MTTGVVRAVVLAAAIAVPRFADATAVSVLGNTDAHECFLSASVQSAAVASLDDCRKALNSGDLANREKAATLVNMGIILNQLARTDEAMSVFEKALVLSPKLPEAALSRGNSHFLRRDYDRAISDYELSIQWGVRDQAAAHFNHGMAHGKKKNYRQAAASYRRAVELNPDFRRAQTRLDRLHSLGLAPKPGQTISAKPRTKPAAQTRPY